MHERVHSELSIKQRNKKRKNKQYRKVYVRKIMKKKSSKSFSKWPFIYKIKKLFKKYKKNKKVVFICLSVKCLISLFVFILEIIL